MLMAALVSLALGREMARRVSVQQEIDRLTKEIAQAEQSTKELEQLMATVQSSTFQEGTARTRFNLQKPGENVLVIPDLETNANASAGEDETKQTTGGRQPDTSNVHRWWEFLFPSTSS